MDSAQVRAKLRVEIDKAGSAAEWGRRHGVSPAYIGDVLREARPAGPKILHALALCEITEYHEVHPIGGHLLSETRMDGDVVGRENCAQALFELDRSISDYDFCRWAKRWGRPALEALIGPLNGNR